MRSPSALLVACVVAACPSLGGCAGDPSGRYSDWTMPQMSASAAPAGGGPATPAAGRAERHGDPWFVYGTEQPDDMGLPLPGGQPDSPGAERLRGGAGPGGIWWTDDVAARAEARHARRNVLIDFWASWCPACLVLDQKTFSDTAVTAELRAYFVPVKLDVSEETEFDKARLRHYRVFSLPSILVLTPEGRELDRIKAYISADDLLDRLQGMRAEAADQHLQAPSAPPPPLEDDPPQ